MAAPLAIALLAVACGDGAEGRAAPGPRDATPGEAPAAAEPGGSERGTGRAGAGEGGAGGARSGGAGPSTTTRAPAVERPGWLGTRVLTTTPGEPPPPTPPELDPRRLPTVDVLPPPPDDDFHASVQGVPPSVAARSTWHEGCPVGLDDLRYVRVSFWGFDGRPHTGELIVHRRAARAITDAFGSLFAARFPIEDMHVTSQGELDAPDTGDGNPTAAFVCRPTRGASSWSQHAYGLAVDVNPFHNPYARDGRVIPGLASSYLDRTVVRPGMVVAGGAAREAFGAVGWRWGGDWSQPDYMHFSANGR